MKNSKQANGITLIANGATLEGTLNAQGSIDIEGKVNGTIKGSGDKTRICVLDSGFVKGDVYAPEVVISGRVEGNIYASKHAVLSKKSVVAGSIFYSSLEIERGAQIIGELMHESKVSEQKTQSTSELKMETHA